MERLPLTYLNLGLVVLGLFFFVCPEWWTRAPAWSTGNVDCLLVLAWRPGEVKQGLPS